MRSRRQSTAMVAVSGLALSFLSVAVGQVGFPQQRNPPGANTSASRMPQAHDQSDHSQAEQELRIGTELASKGQFREAIPHLEAARGIVRNEFAASFNLALSYVGTSQYKRAIDALNDLDRESKSRAEVQNLLAQAYAGDGSEKQALSALEKAAAITPQNEKLYLFVAQACTDNQEYALALKVVAMGLVNLPDSPRLHYERGIVLAYLDEFDRAKPDFDFVSRAAAGSEIGYVAETQRDLFEGDVSSAAKTVREGIQKGFKSPILLTLLGEALLRAGAGPGQTEFEEARSVLEEAVAERASDPSSQIALGRLYLAAGRFVEAIAHLEAAKQMQPDRPAVYANLAKAYQRHGDGQAAQEALKILEKLNLARAEQIRSAPGDRKMSYGGGEIEQDTPPHR